MPGPVLRAGAWPAIAGVTGVAAVVGGCGAAFPAAATMLFPICFALLAAAAAFTLDEPASLVVDVTPTGPVRRRRRAGTNGAQLVPQVAGSACSRRPAVAPGWGIQPSLPAGPQGFERASSGPRALVRAAAPAIIGYPAGRSRLAGHGPGLQASADSGEGLAILA